MTVPFSDARPGEDAFVFRCPPGEDYAWVTEPDWYDDIDEPVTVTRQRWQLISEDQVVFHPRTELCPNCGGEGSYEVAYDDALGGGMKEVRCSMCDGAETHPLAGQMEVLG